MKNKYKFHFVGVGLCLLIALVSCKTTPPVPEQTVIPEKPVVTEEDEDLSKEAEKARSQAITQEADKLFPNLFSKADETLNLGKQVATKNREEAIKSFAEATQMYNTLIALASAIKLKEELDSLDFSDLNKEKYGQAQELYDSSLNKYGVDLDASEKYAKEALSLYTEMCDVAYLELIKNARALAKEAKDRCDSIKAARSMTQSYNEAVQLYNRGGLYSREKNNRDAYKAYMESCDSFNATYKVVEEKRRVAQEALTRARSKITESSSLASEADSNSPLKDGTAGFGELDASMLENKDSEEQQVEEIKE